jgi:hypothetical protein
MKFSNQNIFFSFLVWPLLPTHCWCRGLLLYLTTIGTARTLGRTPLAEWPARRRDLYLTTHNTDIHAPGGIRTCNPSKQVAADPRLRTARPPGSANQTIIKWFITNCWKPTFVYHQLCVAHKPTCMYQQLCVARGSRLEGKRCVTRISGDKCAITWQPRA